jgi:hypothetical protein
METVIAAFLAPFLPYLVRKGEELADQAIDKLGVEAWTRARALWRRLRPSIENKQAASEAAHAVAENPDDDAARGAFQFQLRALLQADSDLKADLEGMLRDARAAGVMADNGAVIIHGGLKADRGGVAVARDVHGGIHTGGPGKDGDE